MTRLGEALRQRFKNPQDAMRALGLDPGDLSGAADIIVGDEKLSGKLKTKETLMSKTNKLTRKAGIAMLALASYLRPKLAQDATLDLRPVLGGVRGLTDRNFGEKTPEIVRAVEASTKGKLAADSSIGEVADLLEMIDRSGSGEADVPEGLDRDIGNIGEKFAERDAMDAEPAAAVETFLKGKLSDDDLAKCMSMMRGGATDEHGEEIDEPRDRDNEKGQGWRSRKGATDENEEEHRENEEEWRRAQGATDEDDDDEEKRAKKGEPFGGKKAEPFGGKDRARGAKDEPPPFRGKPEIKDTKDMVTKPAMDAAIKSAVEAATRHATKNQRDIRDAERKVRPWVGDLAMAHDSAEEVYRTALKMMDVRTEGVHPSAFPVILEMQPLPGARAKGREPRIAADAAGTRSFADRFPDVGRIGLM